ncbi:hypothetical protein ACERCG_07330 [Mannheimia sp. E30BD]|uniref:hypothetical protein n=1 Tax=Mannheimia sp. E30BD TaxID=3278708 RepID=UPI00359EE9A4
MLSILQTLAVNLPLVVVRARTLAPSGGGFETVPAGLNGALTRYKPENVIPTGVGNAIDNALGKYIEYNIENIIIHNGDKK